MKKARTNSYHSIKVRKPQNNIANIASISIKKVPSIEVENKLVQQLKEIEGGTSIIQELEANASVAGQSPMLFNVEDMNPSIASIGP